MTSPDDSFIKGLQKENILQIIRSIQFNEEGLPADYAIHLIGLILLLATFEQDVYKCVRIFLNTYITVLYEKHRSPFEIELIPYSVEELSNEFHKAFLFDIDEFNSDIFAKHIAFCKGGLGSGSSNIGGLVARIDSVLKRFNSMILTFGKRVGLYRRCVYLIKYKEILKFHYFTLLIGHNIHHLTNVSVFTGEYRIQILRDSGNITSMGLKGATSIDDQTIKELGHLLVDGSQNLSLKNCQRFSKRFFERTTTEVHNPIDLESSAFNCCEIT
jgi:hypothetical protein